MMSDKFSLKWNDYHSRVYKSFRSLREEEYLQDVTLVTDDNNQMHAHKLVLSACSEYFKGIFKNNNKLANPILCLSGVHYEDLKIILDYMYNGEIHILQEHLDGFLEIAQRLRLEGLKESNSDDDLQNELTIYKSEVTSKSLVQSSITSKNITNRTKSNESTGEIQKVSSITSNIQELEKQLKQYLKKCQNGLYRCTICGKIGSRSRNLKQHIETHIEGLEFPCENCDKKFRSRNVLNNHIVKYHSKKALGLV